MDQLFVRVCSLMLGGGFVVYLVTGSLFPFFCAVLVMPFLYQYFNALDRLPVDRPPVCLNGRKDRRMPS